MKHFKFTGPQADKHAALADRLMETKTFDKGHIGETEEGAGYYNTLPEGFDKETVIKLAKHNASFVSANKLACQRIAAQAFIDDPKLERVTTSAGFFGGEITSVIRPKKDYTTKIGEGDATTSTVGLAETITISSNFVKGTAKGAGLKPLGRELGDEFLKAYTGKK